MNIGKPSKHKVWKAEEKNGYTKLELGDGKKNKNGSYDNCTWYDATLVGNAKNLQVKRGDYIIITSGIIFKRKYNDKWYDEITIFEAEVMVSDEPETPDDLPDDLPF